MGKMRFGTIATGLILIFLLFFGENKALAKHGTLHTNTLESIIELCNLYELTNHSLPLFCLNCGNGELEPSEQCDDGNNSKNDGCNTDCLFELPRPNNPVFLLEIKA